MAGSIPLKVETLPLLDRRRRVLSDLRISVIDRCNFRCPYCMPEGNYPLDHAFLEKAERMRFEEIERLARIFVGLGVRKIRLTGGEPLLRRELPKLVAGLAGIESLEDLALTSNGSLLPRMAADLHTAGLKRITLSMDSLDPQTYREMSGGRGDVADLHAAIAAAVDAGFATLKLNVVVMRGINDHQVADMVAHFRGSGHVLRFIEYMDVGTCNDWKPELVVPSAELRERIWQLVDGSAEIGFISSVSEPFCGDCTRARLSADGRLYTCLFASTGHDLLGPMRAGATDAELANRISAVWSSRDDRYSEIRNAASSLSRQRVEMYEIGG